MWRVFSKDIRVLLVISDYPIFAATQSLENATFINAMMRRFVFVLALFASTNLQARIGENPEQIAVRYGPSVAQSFDEDGNGVTLYYFRILDVARVTY